MKRFTRKFLLLLIAGSVDALSLNDENYHQVQSQVLQAKSEIIQKIFQEISYRS